MDPSIPKCDMSGILMTGSTFVEEQTLESMIGVPALIGNGAAVRTHFLEEVVVESGV